MGYRDIYKESNEQAEERFSLVMERIAEIAKETDVPETFDDYFKKTAAFLLQLKNITEKAEADTLKDASLAECEQRNASLYEDIIAANYADSYGNPTYAVGKLGEEYGQILSALYAQCRKCIIDAFAAKKMNVTITAELFIIILRIKMVLIKMRSNRRFTGTSMITVKFLSETTSVRSWMTRKISYTRS